LPPPEGLGAYRFLWSRSYLEFCLRFGSFLSTGLKRAQASLPAARRFFRSSFLDLRRRSVCSGTRCPPKDSILREGFLRSGFCFSTEGCAGQCSLWFFVLPCVKPAFPAWTSLPLTFFAHVLIRTGARVSVVSLVVAPVPAQGFAPFRSAVA
jgi:hypothetical protein